MPYVLLLFGAILFVAGVRGNQGTLWTLVRGDFTGDRSFVLWIAAIAVVGGAGYIKSLKPLSVAFMTLLLIVLFLSNKGVIAQLQTFVTNPGSTTDSGIKTTSGATVDNGVTALTPIAAINSNLQSIGGQ